MRVVSRLFVFVLILGLLAAPVVLAGDFQKMNLDQLSAQADKIFRGTVFETREGSLQTAAGEVPTITYVIRVDESFRGDFQVVKGVRVAEITAIGSSKVRLSADQFEGLPLMPAFAKGQDYLVFATAPDANGLTGTVGVGQGQFTIFRENGQDLVVNRHKNDGLFDGMGRADEALTTNGQLSYAQVAGQIRTSLGQ